jgi:UDPglucose 6-dehydrogenase
LDKHGVVEKIKELYRDIDAPMLVTNTTSAETIKYAANAFLATKISFINEIANLCEVVCASIDDVVDGISLDPRIGPDFLRAGLGYGGSCFPKDTRALNFSALSNGYDFRLLKSTIEVNAKQSVMAVRKIAKLLDGLEGKEIALLGLAFKPDTDDVRESPALTVASLLCERGAKLRIYDPAAMSKARPFLSKDVILVPDIYSATDGAQVVFLATDWSEFLMSDWTKIKRAMRPPYVVFDGRNALPQDKLRDLGFRYAGIGRPDY